MHAYKMHSAVVVGLFAYIARLLSIKSDQTTSIPLTEAGDLQRINLIVLQQFYVQLPSFDKKNEKVTHYVDLADEPK